MKEIYFIRHGESIANKYGISAGQSYNISLSNKGRLESHYTGSYLLNHHIEKKFDLIISSNLRRAEATAEIINCYLNINHKTTDLINEINQGLKEGTKKDLYSKKYFKKLKETDPIILVKNYKNLDQDNFDYNYNIYDYKKEFRKDIKIRIEKFLEYLNNLEQKKIIIVTHGGFLLSLFSYLKKSYIEHDHLVSKFIPTYIKKVDNCSISYIKLIDNDFKILLWGSIWHLKSLK